MSNSVLIAPVLIPLLSAVVILLFGHNPGSRRWLNLVCTLLLLTVTGWLWQQVHSSETLAFAVGDWRAPFGIVFVADLFAVSMTVISAFVAAAVALYICGEKAIATDRGYFVSFQLLMMGVNGAFLTGDLFNLFVWFEVMLMSSFVLITYERKADQISGGLKYTVLNLLASFLFLAAVALLYSVTGTLNMADLAVRIPEAGGHVAVKGALALLLIAFGSKAGVFPLFFWLPASYHTPRIATSALLAGLLTKVGLYALVRAVTLLFPSILSFTQPLLIAIAVLTMFTGVLGAVAHFEVRRILGFHIISQIGYMLLGLALFTKAGLAAMFFYVIHHIVVKSNLFLIGGVIERLTGSGRLKQIGGLQKKAPFVAIVFMIPALSLAGLPPLSGFFAKYTLIKAGFVAEHYVAVFVALLVGILTLISMMKIWIEAFWKAAPESTIESATESHERVGFLTLLPIVIMALVTIAFGLFPEILLGPADRVSQELLDPRGYIEAVFGGAE